MDYKVGHDNDNEQTVTAEDRLKEDADAGLEKNVVRIRVDGNVMKEDVEDCTIVYIKHDDVKDYVVKENERLIFV